MNWLKSAQPAFTPAINLMNRLKYPQKFTLISCIFVLPLSVSMYLLLSEVQSQANFSRKEVLGNRYLRPLQTLSTNFFQYRLLQEAHFHTSNPDLLRLPQLEKEIAANLEQMEAVEQELGTTLQTTSHFQALHATWATLLAHHNTWSPETINVFYHRLFQQVEDLRSQVGDQSNLILDPDLDTYYLMDATLLKIPVIQQNLADIQVISQRISSRGYATPEERSRLITLAETIRKTSQDLANQLEVAFNNNPAGNLRPTLTQPLNRLTESANLLTGQVIALTYPDQSPKPIIYFSHAAQTLGHSLTLWDVTSQELDRLLKNRIQGLVHKQISLSIFVLSILSVVAYLYIAFYLGVMKTVWSLSFAAKRMTDGSLTETITLESQDELAQVVHSFNTIASALIQANQEISQLNQRLQYDNLRMSAELDITRQLQQMLLPTEAELEEIIGLEIAGFMEPAAEVGGDYYDVLQQDGKVKISIGDVTGHGLESGVVMLMAQTAVRTLLASGETNPARFLNAVNHIIYENTRRMQSHKNMTLALLEYEAGVLRLAGQHEELILVRQDGQIEQIDTLDLGFPLGLESDITPFVGETKVQLQPGDIAILYTDGITEAINLQKQQYGLVQLYEVLQQNRDRSAQQIREAVIDNLRLHIGEQKVFDDITLVVMKQK